MPHFRFRSLLALAGEMRATRAPAGVPAARALGARYGCRHLRESWACLVRSLWPLERAEPRRGVSGGKGRGARRDCGPHVPPPRLGAGASLCRAGGAAGRGRSAGRGASRRWPLQAFVSPPQCPMSRSRNSAGSWLVDVRSREGAAAGSIPGALNIPGTEFAGSHPQASGEGLVEADPGGGAGPSNLGEPWWERAATRTLQAPSPRLCPLLSSWEAASELQCSWAVSCP